ncbi:hypothetical protein [Sorangium sp. So ce1024]|uniref:hypothetical protein n=1 Tax=unclassified Sorangium TaxID=2621164 RepID=UPI003F06D5E5
MSRALTASCACPGSEALVLGTAACTGGQVGSRAAGLRWWRWWCTTAGPHDG